jgi:hypothetical protein
MKHTSDIDRFAEQAGFPARRAFSDLSDLYPRLERFAALVAAAQRQWVEPTDEEIDDIYQGAGSNDLKRARAIGTLYKEKNT